MMPEYGISTAKPQRPPERLQMQQAGFVNFQ
jgi:hypothetical protein